MRFFDLDLATCPRGAFLVQYPPSSGYAITFSTTEPSATFIGGVSIGGVNSITVNVAANYPIPNPVDPLLRCTLYRSQNATLTLGAGWAGNIFNVIATIVDIPNPLDPCNTGNAQDPNYVTNWIIDRVPPGIIPTTIIRQTPPSPLIADWTPLMGGNGATFRYLLGIDAPPLYDGFLVTETFEMPSAGAVFTMADILPSFQATHPLLVTEDQIANFIFGTATPNSLPINNISTFDDTHGGYVLIPGINLSTVFTAPAIAANRVGYMLQQHYSCCASHLSDPQIRRRITNIVAGDIELNKTD